MLLHNVGLYHCTMWSLATPDVCPSSTERLDGGDVIAYAQLFLAAV
jgi:hypothetical protein